MSVLPRTLPGAPVVVLVSCIFTSACISGPPAVHPYRPGVPYSNPNLEDFTPSGDPNFQGRDYCTALESTSRQMAITQLRQGYTLSLLGLGLVGAGTVLSATEGDDPTPERKALDLSLPVAGALFGLAAVVLLNRSNDASDLASAATTAIQSTRTDVEANDLCLAAHSAWDSNRSSASKAVSERLSAAQPGAPGAGGKPGTTAAPGAGGASGATAIPAAGAAGAPARP